MVKMIDVEGNGDWVVLESLCSVDRNGRLEFQWCSGCVEHYAKKMSRLAVKQILAKYIKYLRNMQN